MIRHAAAGGSLEAGDGLRRGASWRRRAVKGGRWSRDGEGERQHRDGEGGQRAVSWGGLRFRAGDGGGRPAAQIGCMALFFPNRCG
jgi:hypothetical protein